jgi:hypothetical protein
VLPSSLHETTSGQCATHRILKWLPNCSMMLTLYYSILISVDLSQSEAIGHDRTKYFEALVIAMSEPTFTPKIS